MKRSELYKSFQLYDFFVNRYSYTSFRLIGGNFEEGELWLVGKENPNYQVIRITNKSTESAIDESEKINSIMEICRQKFFIRNIKFLDIHVCNDEVYDEKYDTACIEIGFHSGLDLSDIYPGIYEVLHETQDEEKEIRRLLNSINTRIKDMKEKERHRSFFYKIKNSPIIVTLSLIAVCVALHLIVLSFPSKYSASGVMIYMGADYKMFTLGLGQFWRLFTCAFLHSSWLHLITNMLSFLIIGSVVEPRLGHLKYLFMLFCGILTASLTHGALSGNSIVVGLSGGIYCIFAYFIIYYVGNRLIDIRSITPTIMINLFLNFLPNVSWQAHLGGAICGILFFYIYRDDRIDLRMLPLVFIIIFGLFFKYYRDAYIKPYYGGTDLEVLRIMRDNGKTEKAHILEKRLYEIYENGK